MISLSRNSAAIRARYSFCAWPALLAVAFAAALAGCSSAPAGPVTYLLESPDFAPLEANGNSVQVLVGNVQVANYVAGTRLTQLQQGQRLVRTRHHAWAEPLSDQLARQIRHGLKQLLPTSDWLPLATSGALQHYDGRLDVQIDSFHLTANGEAEVAGTWQLRDASQHFMAHGQFKHQQVLPADGYDAMVQALDEAWQASLQDIAQQLHAAVTSNGLGTD